MKTSWVLCGLLAWPMAGGAQPILLADTTEEAPPGMAALPAGLVDPLLRRVDGASARMFRDCLQHEGIPRQRWPEQFLAIRLPSPLAGRSLYYVRPALDTACRAFYGAHAFQHWLVEYEEARGPASLRMVFDSVGDGFDILPDTSEGRYHLVTRGCHASGCHVTQWRMRRGRYVRQVCWDEPAPDGGTVRRKRSGCAS